MALLPLHPRHVVAAARAAHGDQDETTSAYRAVLGLVEELRYDDGPTNENLNTYMRRRVRAQALALGACGLAGQAGLEAALAVEQLRASVLPSASPKTSAPPRASWRQSRP